MSPAHGRPPSSDPKNINLRIKLTKSQKAELDYCTEITNHTQSDVMRQALHEAYLKLKEKNG